MSNKRTTFASFFIEKIFIQTVLVLGIVGFGWALADNSVLRWDLTEDQRFTIEESSHRIAASVPDRLTIRAYFTKKLPERVVPFYRQVIDILREYEAASGGQIKLEQFDPSESSSAKKEAESYGIRPVDLMIFEATARKKVEVWGSIVLLFRDRASETINLASRYPQGYEGLSGLEYELSSRIWQLANDKPTLGITGHLSSAPPSANPMNPMGGQPRPMFQGLRRVLGDAFTIQDVDLNQAEPDPAKIPCLMVVRPKEFNDIQQFRLDQYMMKGGRVLMFITLGERGPGMMGQGVVLKQFPTGLEDWLSHHGARVPAEFVMHFRAAYPVPVQAQVRPGVVQDVMFPCPFFPIISRDMENCLSDDNPAIQSLRSTVFLWAHPVEVVESNVGKDVTANVLVRSSEKQSWRWKDMNRMDPQDAINGLQSGKDYPTAFFSSPMIVAFDGEFDSFYAKNPVPPSLKGDADKNDAENDDATTLENEDESKAEKKSDGPDVVKKSKKTHLVVVGNAFFISDLLLGGNSRDDRGKEAAQVAFNLVDWLARSPELIALRAKKYTSRDLVDSVEDVLDDLETEYTEGKINADTFKDRLSEAQEAQKAERKKYRWLNSIGPAGAILLVGLVVWILRLAFRAASATVPFPVSPDDDDAESEAESELGDRA